MKDYLRVIKVTADSLASTYNTAADADLVHYTMSGLPPSYESFVMTITYMLGIVTFDDLQSKLIFYEYRVFQQQARDNQEAMHQAYSTDPMGPLASE